MVLERIPSETAYLLFYLTKRGKVHVHHIVYSEAKFALDQGLTMKEKGECVDYGYVKAESPPLFMREENDSVRKIAP